MTLGRLVRRRCVSRGADGGGAESVDVADVGRLDTPLDRAAAGRTRVDKLLDTFEERLHVAHREPGFGRIVVGHRQITSIGAQTCAVTKLGDA